MAIVIFKKSTNDKIHLVYDSYGIPLINSPALITPNRTALN